MTGRRSPAQHRGRQRAAFSSFGRRARKERRGRPYSQGSGTRGACAEEGCPSAQAELQYQTPPRFCDASPRLARQTGQDPPPFATQRSMAGQSLSDRRGFGKRAGSAGRGGG